MILRVRGSGGCAENSEAIVMNLRGYCQRFPGRREASAASMTTPLAVTLDCSYCTLSAVWKEVWNLVDIVYDALSQDAPGEQNKVVGNGEVVVAVPHLTWSGDGDRGSREKCIAEATALLRSSFTPGLGDVEVRSASKRPPVVLCFVVAGEPSHWLGALWQLSFICTVMIAAGASYWGWEQRVRQIIFVTDSSTEESPQPLSPSIQCVVRHWFPHLRTEHEAAVVGSTDDAVDLVRVVSMNRLHPFGRATWVGGSTPLSGERATIQWFRTDANATPERIVETAQRLADELQVPASLHVVPVRRFSSGDDPNSAMEQAALAKENMVLNFCPCCGHTDEGRICGHC